MKKLSIEQLELLREMILDFVENTNLDKNRLDLIDQVWYINYENFLTKE
jgi:hypothetical protein